MSGEMVERMAKAMADRDQMGAAPEGPRHGRLSWRAYVGMARAALGAMRDPEDAILDAGGITEDMWGLMIDEALR